MCVCVLLHTHPEAVEEEDGRSKECNKQLTLHLSNQVFS